MTKLLKFCVILRFKLVIHYFARKVKIITQICYSYTITIEMDSFNTFTKVISNIELLMIWNKIDDNNGITFLLTKILMERN